jgi:hypothetical protein
MSEKRVCKSCDIEKDVTEFNNSGGVENGHVWCRECDNKSSRTRKRRFCTIMMPNGNIEDWVIQQKTNLAPFLEKEGEIVHSWVQPFPENLDEWPRRGELLQGLLKKVDLEAGEKMGPAVPKPPKDEPEPKGSKDMPEPYTPATETLIVPELDIVTTTQAITRARNEGTVKKNWANNLAVEFNNVCPLTREGGAGSQANHLFYLKWCRGDFAEYAWHPENGIFASAHYNHQCEYNGHFTHPDGYIAIVEGYFRSKILDATGAYWAKVELSDMRRFFAGMTMERLLAGGKTFTSNRS